MHFQWSNDPSYAAVPEGTEVGEEARDMECDFEPQNDDGDADDWDLPGSAEGDADDRALRPCGRRRRRTRCSSIRGGLIAALSSIKLGCDNARV